MVSSFILIKKKTMVANFSDDILRFDQEFKTSFCFLTEQRKEMKFI